jgi:hypothetical protein
MFIYALGDIPLGEVEKFASVEPLRFGMPFFTKQMKGLYSYVKGEQRKCLMFCSFHSSGSGKHSHCAAFGGKTEAAKAHAFALRDQFDRVFGLEDGTFFPIVVHVDTDTRGMTFYGDWDHILDINAVQDPDPEYFTRAAANLFAQYPENIRGAIAEFMWGNYLYREQFVVRGNPCVEHGEQVLYFGDGFAPWSNDSGLALTLGQYVGWEASMDELLKVLLNNFVRIQKPIPKEEGLGLVCVADYRGGQVKANGFIRRVAIERANYLLEIALKRIKDTHPVLLQHLHCVRAIVDRDDQRLQLL